MSKRLRDAVFGLGGERRGRLYKYEHYLFIVSILGIVLSLLALLNGYYHYFNFLPHSSKNGIPSEFLVAGYLGMFVTVAFVPIPDYILVTIYGYLASIGIFSPLETFVACTAGALFLMAIEYFGGRFVGRIVLLKLLSYFHITEKDIAFADRWILKHGKFSMFIATFIPYLYSVTSLAAGTLKMNAPSFFLACLAGFGLRFAFLEYVGYSSIYVFTPSFDYSERGLFYSLMALFSTYVALYLVRHFRYTHPLEKGAHDSPP